MYQKSKKSNNFSNSLSSLPALSIFDQEHIHFNFKYCLELGKIEDITYAAILKKIISTYSKATIDNFKKIAKAEKNDKIIKRQKNQNQQFIKQIYNGDLNKLTITYDIYRSYTGKAARACGILIKNILYVLEIDPNHDR